MAKEILTKEQKKFLEIFKSQKDLANIFYLTGGSALANYYLKHRYSEDLDFFTDKEDFDWEAVFSFMKRAKKQLQAEDLVYDRMFDRRIFYLKFSDNKELKIEFTLYPFKQIKRCKSIEGILVDSLLDIAANKLFSIFERQEIKDYIDLYFLLKKFTLKKLHRAVTKKFGITIEPITLGTYLIEVKDLEPLPRMIKKITLKKVRNFFLSEARKLKAEIFY